MIRIGRVGHSAATAAVIEAVNTTSAANQRVVIGCTFIGTSDMLRAQRGLCSGWERACAEWALPARNMCLPGRGTIP